MKFDELKPEQQARALRVLEVFQLLTTAVSLTNATTQEEFAVIELFRLKLPPPCCEKHGNQAKEIAALLAAEMDALLLKDEAGARA